MKPIRLGDLLVRTAEWDDLDEYIRIQQTSWGEKLAVKAEQAKSRFSANLEGIVVAEHKAKLIGFVTTIRIDHYDLDRPMSWNVATNNGMCTTHRPNGKIFFGVDLSIDQELAPHGTNDALFVGVANMVIGQGGKYVLLGGRIPGYSQYKESMTPEDYLRAKTEDGRYIDQQVEMYSRVPFVKILGLVPDYFQDPASDNYGVLIRYRNPVYNLPGKKLWAAAARWAYSKSLTSRRKRFQKG